MTAEADIANRAGGAGSAERLARLARRAPESLLRAALSRPTRRPVVAQIFRRMPAQLKAGAALPDAIVRWELTSAGDPFDTWFIVFEAGACRTTRAAPAAEPRTSLSLEGLDFLRLSIGAANPIQMFQAGRIKISGDLFFAAQVQGLFAIPR